MIKAREGCRERANDNTVIQIGPGQLVHVQPDLDPPPYSRLDRMNRAHQRGLKRALGARGRWSSTTYRRIVASSEGRWVEQGIDAARCEACAATPRPPPSVNMNQAWPAVIERPRSGAKEHYKEHCIDIVGVPGSIAAEPSFTSAFSGSLMPRGGDASEAAAAVWRKCRTRPALLQLAVPGHLAMTSLSFDRIFIVYQRRADKLQVK